MRSCCCCCRCFPLFCSPPPQFVSLYLNAFFTTRKKTSRKHIESHTLQFIDSFKMKINLYIWCLRCCHCCFTFRIYHKSSVTKKTYPNICSCQYSGSTIISYFSRSVNLMFIYLSMLQVFFVVVVHFTLLLSLLRAIHAQVFRFTNVVVVAYDGCCHFTLE